MLNLYKYPLKTTKSIYEVYDLLNEKIPVTADYNSKLKYYTELYNTNKVEFIEKLFFVFKNKSKK